MENLVLCLDIIISVRQLAPTQEKNENCQQTRQLPLSVCLPHVDTHQSLRCFQGAKIHLHAVWKKIRHYCVTVHHSVLCNTNMHQDKHIISLLMIHFLKLSLHLSAFASLSLPPAAASLRLPLICFLCRTTQ